MHTGVEMARMKKPRIEYTNWPSAPHGIPAANGSPGEWYTVKKGDTLESIASQAGWTWSQLAEYNWGTREPREINYYLKHYLTNLEETRDGDNYILTSGNKVWVPKTKSPTASKAVSGNGSTAVPDRALDTPTSPHISRLAAKRNPHSDGCAHNTANPHVKVYMNIGSWTGNLTTFGLVCDNQIALCSWKPADCNQYVYWNKLTDRRTNGVGDCLRRGPTRIENKLRAMLHPSIVILASYRAPGEPGEFSFTEPGETILFLPDCHIPLFRGSIHDKFIYESEKKGRCSLAGPLKDLLDWAASNKMRVIQLGDLYEVWDAQAVYLDCVDKLRLETPSGLKKYVPGLLYDAYCDRWGVIDKTWRSQVSLQCYPAPENHPSAIDFVSEDALIEAIKQQYGELTNYWTVLDSKDYIRGNHDCEQNRFLYRYYLNRRQWESLSVFDRKVATVDWVDLDDQLVSRSEYHRCVGQNDCIRYEHGHAFDPYNNFQTWKRHEERPRGFWDGSEVAATKLWRNSGGFQSTREYLATKVQVHGARDSLKGIEYVKQVMLDLPRADYLDGQDWIGNKALEVFAYHRVRTIWAPSKNGLKTKEKDDDCNKCKGEYINLIVMGHTHVPHLEDYTNYWFAAGRRVMRNAWDNVTSAGRELADVLR